MNYNHQEIEKKWQKHWELKQTFKVNLESTKPKFYALDMFPYPSGQGLHVGHPEGYTATDIISRWKRMLGFEVLHPIGFDAFGLPAEQYAIKTGNSPRDFTYENIQNFIKQLKLLGFSFNWEQSIITSEPYYYKHTQWIFAQLHKNNLTELKDIEVNWCQELNTVLSNEEVLQDQNGNPVSERGGFPVVKKPMKQWVLKITKYADRLFEGLEELDWPTSIKKLQRNWIYNEGDSSKGLHLRDWLFSRQRYWGEPFPIVHLDGEIYLIPEKNYPIILPEISDYSFSKDGKPSLSKATSWINYDQDGIKGVRDLNTMPQWAASSWYYIAYILKTQDKKGNDYLLDLDSKKAKTLLKKWLPVDLYIGGQEHAVLHLLYARFWHLFLYDLGIVSHKEPFQKLYNQGMILGEDGEKMSKSKGNTISPDTIIELYGADSLRLYEMFMGPLGDDKPWSSKGIQGIRSWLDRVFAAQFKHSISDQPADEAQISAYNQLLNDTNRYLEDLKFNNVISAMMVFVNFIYKNKVINRDLWKDFLKILSLFAPHIASEMWSKVAVEEISSSDWPTIIPLVTKKQTNLAIQLNGKLKQVVIEEDYLNEVASFNKAFTELSTIQLEQLAPLLTFVKASDFKRVIYVKGKILNFIN